jgi:NADH-quinone oxidoreductase subunit L
VGIFQDVLQRVLASPESTVPWLVPLLPLFGFTVLAIFGDRMRKDGEGMGGMLLACCTVVASFLLSVWTVVVLFTRQGGIGSTFGLGPFDWIAAGDVQIPFSLRVDALTAVMMLTVTGVGSLIHIYSLGYMSHDEEPIRYFSYLNLFTFFMLVLVMAGSLPLLFVGWEGVGLCSYLLIGFWYKKQSASDAGKKAFIVNRIGDAGLILAMALLQYHMGTLDLFEVAQNAGTLQPAPWVTAVCLLLFLGACGKSAQIPLHVWLPDAMEGPTPVSALIHAATMVTAGVYLTVRLAALYTLSPTAMMVVACVGTLTAIMAATVALVQTDIKRVLAYSTVSQLGYMFLAVGVGAFGVAIFHLFTHAFFKALLFLGSGSVIHACSGEQDMRKMGGLRKHIPWTYWTFLVGTLAIAGIPPLAGFFSKDAILAAALAGHHPVLFGVGLLTALLTSFYMARLLFMTFFGEYRGDLLTAHAAPVVHDAHAVAHVAPAAHPAHADDHADAHADPQTGASDHGHASGHGHAGGIHESPWTMLLPLVLLAIGSAAVGFLKIPEIVWPALLLDHQPHEAHAAWLPFLATITAVLGIAGAYNLYVLYPGYSQRIASSARGLVRVLEEKWGFDIAYNWFASRMVVGGSRSVLWRGVDTALIDGAVNGTAGVVGGIAQATRTIQSGLVRGYALVILGGAVVVVGYLLWRP